MTPPPPPRTSVGHDDLLLDGDFMRPLRVDQIGEHEGAHESVQDAGEDCGDDET